MMLLRLEQSHMSVSRSDSDKVVVVVSQKKKREKDRHTHHAIIQALTKTRHLFIAKRQVGERQLFKCEEMKAVRQKNGPQHPNNGLPLTKEAMHDQGRYT